MIVVSDTSPLNYLAIIDGAFILPELYGKVIVPAEVFKELYAIVYKPEIEKLLSCSWLEVQDPTIPLVPEMILQNLDKGERSAIILARELHSSLLIDERKGRLAAKYLGVEIIGVLGLLLAAKQTGLIPSARMFISRLLQETNFRIADTMVQKILEQANEQ